MLHIKCRNCFSYQHYFRYCGHISTIRASWTMTPMLFRAQSLGSSIKSVQTCSCIPNGTAPKPTTSETTSVTLALTMASAAGTLLSSTSPPFQMGQTPTGLIGSILCPRAPRRGRTTVSGQCSSLFILLLTGLAKIHKQRLPAWMQGYLLARRTELGFAVIFSHDPTGWGVIFSHNS